MAQLHLSFEPQVDRTPNAPVGRPQKWSKFWTLPQFWRIQNVIKYQSSSLKLLRVGAGASPGCAKKFVGLGNSRDWFHFHFRHENLAGHIFGINRAADIKFAAYAEALNVYLNEF